MTKIRAAGAIPLGRPRAKVPKHQVRVSLPEPVFDFYARLATRLDSSLEGLLTRVLIRRAKAD